MRLLLLLPVFPSLVFGLSPQDALAVPLDPVTITVEQVSENTANLVIQAGSSGAPYGIWLEWMTRTEFIANGWTGSGQNCLYDGVPTLNTNGTALSYRLGPNEMIEVELGNVFDETGAWSPDTFPSTLTSPSMDCIHTADYWKGNPGQWLAATLTLGTPAYTKSQMLDNLNLRAQGNGLIILSHRLIAAKLNLVNGANAPTNVLQAIADADALIGGLVIPPHGNGYLKPKDVKSLKDTLESFNNGTGGGNCTPVPTETVTWGEIKALFTDN